MKKMYINFVEQYRDKDFDFGAMVYGAEYNILAIEKVTQTIIRDGYLYVYYKEGRKIHITTFDLKSIKVLTIN